MGDSSRKYENGKVYCIRNNCDTDVYVGHTTQTLSKRMQKHRASMLCEKKRKMFIIPKDERFRH